MSYKFITNNEVCTPQLQEGWKNIFRVFKICMELCKTPRSFSPEAVKSRTDKFLAERHEAMSKTAKATPSKEYNNLNIPASAYYNPNSTHYGAHYVGD